jgi:hypothetical protein
MNVKVVLAAVLAGAMAAHGQSAGEARELRGLAGNMCSTYIAVGGACNTDGSCVASAYCDSAKMACVALPGANKPCGGGIFCAAGLGCNASSDGVCKALPRPNANGDCLWGLFGQRMCGRGLNCYSVGTRNVCKDPNAVTNGDCSVNLLCGAGKGCSIGATQRCVASAPLNAKCPGNTPGICQSGLYCNTRTTRCAKLLTDGASCVDPAACATGLTCLPSLWGFKCKAVPNKVRASCVDRCANTSTGTPLNCRL